MEHAPWAGELHEALLRRNATEVYAFKTLIEAHSRAQATAKSLSTRNAVLERSESAAPKP